MKFYVFEKLETKWLVEKKKLLCQDFHYHWGIIPSKTFTSLWNETVRKKSNDII